MKLSFDTSALFDGDDDRLFTDHSRAAPRTIPQERKDKRCKKHHSLRIVVPLRTDKLNFGMLHDHQVWPQARALKILIVGDLARWAATGTDLPCIAGVRFVDIRSLSAPLLADFLPDLVFSPLVAQTFDAVDVAHVLQGLGFTGRYRIIADALPNTEDVRKDISNAAPDLDVGVLNIPHLR